MRHRWEKKFNGRRNRRGAEYYHECVRCGCVKFSSWEIPLTYVTADKKTFFKAPECKKP